MIYINPDYYSDPDFFYSDNHKKETKDTHIGIRISREEKNKMYNTARKEGFQTISTYLKWLYRKYGNK